MSPNRTSVWKVMTIWISRELPSFNFDVSIYYALESNIGVKSYDHLNFSRASVIEFRALRYIMSPNRTSVWKVMTIWISREFPFFNFERLDILCPQIGHSCEKLWPFEFLESFRCSISSVSIYCVPEADICVKSYEHLNFSRASIFQCWACRYLMSPYTKAYIESIKHEWTTIKERNTWVECGEVLNLFF